MELKVTHSIHTPNPRGGKLVLSIDRAREHRFCSVQLPDELVEKACTAQETAGCGDPSGKYRVALTIKGTECTVEAMDTADTAKVLDDA